MIEQITPRSQALEAALRWGGPIQAVRTIIDAAEMFLDFLEGRSAPVVAVQIEPVPARTEAAREGDAPEPPTVNLNIPHSAAERAKRTRRTKAEMEAARAAEAAGADGDGDGAAVQAAQATAEATPAPAAEAPPPPPSTFADAKAALTRVVETNGLGVEAATGLLKKFAVARLSQLEEGQWTGFVLACETAVKGAAV